jgi:hypothetical protein
VGDGRYHQAVGEDPQRQADQRAQGAEFGHGRDHHAGHLAGRHPDRLEHAQVATALAGAEHDGVEHAERGDERQQHGEQRRGGGDELGADVDFVVRRRVQARIGLADLGHVGADAGAAGELHAVELGSSGTCRTAG